MNRRIARRLILPTPPRRITASTELTQSDSFPLIATTGITVTLPLAADVPGMEIFLAVDIGVASYTLRAQGNDGISDLDEPNGATTTVVNGSTIAYSDGVDRWYLTED